MDNNSLSGEPDCPRPSSWAVWLLALRPKTLSAAAVPVVVGSALAIRDELFEPLAALVALLCAGLIQIGANFANDLFDFKKGADNENRIGPTRATQAGWVSEAQMTRATMIAFALAMFFGLYLVFVGGWPVLLIGLASIAAGVAYTGGPYPLGYHGLGELFVFLFFGVIAVCGTYYVQTLDFSSTALLCSIPVGLLAAAILMVNNIRDIKTDKEAGKHTIAVRLGAEKSRYLYLVTLLFAWLSLPLIILLGRASCWVLLPWLLLPLAIKLIATVFQHSDGLHLNNALADTAKLGVQFGLLLSAGIVVGG